MIKLSANRLKTFLECKNKYFLHYICGMETPKNIFLIRGTSVHAAFEAYHRGENPFTAYNVTWLAEMAAAPHVEHVSRIFLEGYDYIETYIQHQDVPRQDVQRQDAQTEVYFCLPFPNEHKPLAFLKGYIDLIVHPQTANATGVIVDYKTSKDKPKALDDDLQFIIYAWAYEQLYKQPAIIYWYHCRTGEYIQANVHGDDKLKKVHDVVAAVLEYNKDPQFEVRAPCRWCIARDTCSGVALGADALGADVRANV